MAPLRKILSRKFVAYSGTEITLDCGHAVFSSKARLRQKSMRCAQCGDLAEVGGGSK